MSDMVQSASTIQGTIGVDDVLADKQIIDMTPTLEKLYVNDSPLFRIFNMMPKGPAAKNVKINWLRKDEFPRWSYLKTTVGASGSAGATVTLIPATTPTGAADTTRYSVGDVIQVPDVIMTDSITNLGVITAVSAGTSITVDPIGYDSNGNTTHKSFGATTATSEIYTVQNASEEFSLSPDSKVVKDTVEWNYINFQRTPFVVGNLEAEIAQYSGKERSERSDETMRYARRSAESAMIFGDRFKLPTGAGGQGAQYFMRGLWEYIRQGAGSNILTNWTAGFSESDLDEYLAQGPCKIGYGSNKRLWFVSTELYLKLLSLMKLKVNALVEKKAFGMEFMQYTAPNGNKILLKEHAIFSNAHEGKGIILDPTTVSIRNYGAHGPLRLLRDIQENDRAGIKDEWQTIFSTMIRRIEPNGIQTP